MRVAWLVLLFALMVCAGARGADTAKGPEAPSSPPPQGNDQTTDAQPEPLPGREAAGETIQPAGEPSPPTEGPSLVQGTVPSADSPSVRNVSNAVPEILSTLEELQKLIVVAIAVSLISILVNAVVLLAWLRRRHSQAAQEDLKEDMRGPAPAPFRPEPPAARPLPDSPPLVESLPAPSPVPPSRQTESQERPLPSPSRPEPDDFAGMPHAAMGRTLRQLHQALPDLARRIPDPRQQERFLADLDQPLKARIERLKEAAGRGEPYLKEHWIEQDLVTTLNVLAQWLSSVIEERKRGRRGNQGLEDELLRWLYERLAPACRDEGWFSVEPILPLVTRFDPKIHYSVGSVALEGAANLVVTIKAIGRRDLQQSYVTHKAEVIVGR